MSSGILPTIGQRFTNLVVKSRTQGRKFLCVCDCGNEREFAASDLTGGNNKSCGCRRAAEARRLLTVHGQFGSPLHKIWTRMISRCHRKSDNRFRFYGARGIAVCNKWRQSFMAFASDMGPRPSPAHSIDRINNDGNYEPGNCRWATRDVQMHNKRQRGGERKIAAFGELLNSWDWSKKTGIRGKIIAERVFRYGWPAEKALTTPVRQRPFSQKPIDVLIPAPREYVIPPSAAEDA